MATHTTAHFRQHATAISGKQCRECACMEGDKRYTAIKKQQQ